MPPSYAVLFKCHFWDDFTQRQIDRLRERIGRGDVFVFVDETKRPAGDVGHEAARVIRATEADITTLGLARYEGFSQFWYSADYALHLLTRSEPDYDYYVMVEFDLVLNRDLDAIIDEIAAEEVDFVSHPIPDPPIEQFHWLYTAEGVYARTELRHWLTCIAIFSNRAAHTLFERRLAMTARFSAGEIRTWPMCELAIPTEMSLCGLTMKPLGELGSLEFYRWAPPFDESALPSLSAGTFVHPVLDANRFLTNIMRWHPKHEELLDPDSTLWRRFGGAMSKRLALPFLFEEERQKGRTTNRSRIIERMHEVGDEPYLALHGRDGRNLALGKRTMQSSWIGGRPEVEPWGEAVVGVVTGGDSFHTEADERPWWMVDLGEPADIGVVRVFNRMDVRQRADGLLVLVSMDAREWHEAGRHEGSSFGGADGHPLIIAVDRTARFVRLELPRQEYLHLDQVQVIRARRDP